MHDQGEAKAWYSTGVLNIYPNFPSGARGREQEYFGFRGHRGVFGALEASEIIFGV